MITNFRLGYISAILTAVFAAAFLGLGFFGSSFTEGIKYPYVLTTIRPIDYLVWYPGFMLALSFLVLTNCINTQAPPERKVFSHIALTFATLYAGLILSNYFIQWTVVVPSILSKETDYLSLVSQYNPHGLFIALESLGYLMLDTSLLFLALVFGGSARLMRSVRWLFVGGFVSAIVSFFAFSLVGYPIVVFEVVVITINVVVLIPAGALLRIFFKRTAT